MPLIKFYKRLSLIDIVNFSFLAVVVVFFIFSFHKTPYRAELIISYTLLFAFVVLMAYLRKSKIKLPNRQLILFIYPLIFFFLLFETIWMLLPYFNNVRYDELMAKIDFSLLTINPTAWIEFIINPYLTDFMYLCYFFYFPMPLIIVGWMFKKKMFPEIQDTIIFYFICYYTAYITYFLVPVEGPRFYLAALHTVKLDGIILAEPVRQIVNFFESNKLDCFPSLHSAILIVTMMVTWKHNKKLYYVFFPFAIGIMISLIYCRYHYFIDMIAGLFYAIGSFYISKLINNKFGNYFTFHFAESEG